MFIQNLFQGNYQSCSIHIFFLRDKEEKKKAILEQHVNMTKRQEEMKMIDGKKVCWMYRKGRCRQGSKCSFAHDNDVKTDRVVEIKYDADSQISNNKSAKGAVQQIRLNPVQERDISPPKVSFYIKGIVYFNQLFRVFYWNMIHYYIAP